MKPFITRSYNNIIYSNNILSKSSNNPKIKDEIGYLLDIQTTDLCKYFPQVYAFTDSMMELDYYEYPNVHEYIVQTDNIDKSLLNSIKQFLSDAQKITIESSFIDINGCALTQMLIEKTEREYQALVNNNIYFQNLSQDKFVFINGNQYENFSFIWDKVKNKLIKHIADIKKTETPCVIHGDFCFSNMLISPKRNQLKLIDPRGSFGIKGIWGYQIYDIAKLAHSIHGKYELIINDLFSVEHDLNSIIFQFHTDISKKYNQLQQYYNFTDFEMLVMATIFIGMCARHSDSLSRQIIMYATGIKYLNEYL